MSNSTNSAQGSIGPESAAQSDDDLTRKVEQIAAVLKGLTEDLVKQRAARAQGQARQAPRVEDVRRLLELRSTLLVAEVAREFSVSVNSAARLMRTIAHEGHGILQYEPHGNTDRLRLYRDLEAVMDRLLVDNKVPKR